MVSNPFEEGIAPLVVGAPREERAKRWGGECLSRLAPQAGERQASRVVEAVRAGSGELEAEDQDPLGGSWEELSVAATPSSS